MNQDSNILIDRDISWLSFNYRVLQEAKDKRVPLFERIKFLAIYSSNLDEFFRVRIPAIRNYKKLRKKEKDRLRLNPKQLLKEVRQIVQLQQEELGRVYREEILPQLEENHIHLINNENFNAVQRAFAKELFFSRIFQLVKPAVMSVEGPVPFLKNKHVYLIGFFSDQELGIVELPTTEIGRFVVMPSDGKEHYISYLDDLIRDNFNAFFPKKTLEEIISVKVSRDAELYIDDEFEGDLVGKIMERVYNRETGLPTRFLYDESIESNHLNQLVSAFQLHENDLIPGGRYHNFHDFWDLPDPIKKPELHDPSFPCCPHPALGAHTDLIDRILARDFLLSFPYQCFEYIPQLIHQAAMDPRVTGIKITLYRVSRDSKIAKALKFAAESGKKVTAFLEVKARFDEESNFYWGNELRNAGAKVIFSFPGIKVHSKLFLIRMSLPAEIRHIAYLGTGNFNEKTANIYCDHALLTSSDELARDVDQVFQILERRIIIPNPKHIMVAPFSLRNGFEELIEEEMEQAGQGKEAYIIAKMNSLEDEEMIMKLYEASQRGVKIQLIIRGICRLIPGKETLSENIEARSIVDRYLEHARVYIFGNGGREKMFLASADWMTRNLDKRVEVAFPIYDQAIYREIRRVIELQLSDNVKARSLNEGTENQYIDRKPDEAFVRAQFHTYSYFADLANTVKNAEIN